MLIAIIDADKATCKQRYDDLLRKVEDRSGIFVFVPRRNIETWMRALNRFPADEESDYKFQECGDERTAAAEFLVLVRSANAPHPLPSLQSAIEEARGMPKNHLPAGSVR